MNCPKCNEPEARVMDSRNRLEGKEVYRRRRCLACGYRFTTLETVVKISTKKKEKLGW